MREEARKILEAKDRLSRSIRGARMTLATDDGKAGLFMAIAPRAVDHPGGITAEQCARVLGWLSATLTLMDMALQGKLCVVDFQDDQPVFKLRDGQGGDAP